MHMQLRQNREPTTYAHISMDCAVKSADMTLEAPIKYAWRGIGWAAQATQQGVEQCLI